MTKNNLNLFGDGKDRDIRISSDTSERTVYDINHWAELWRMLGYMSGIIHGVGMRKDVPEDLRQVCIKADEKYKKFMGGRYDYRQ